MIWLSRSFKHLTGTKDEGYPYMSPPRVITRNTKVFKFEFSHTLWACFSRYGSALTVPLVTFPFSPADWMATLSLRAHLDLEPNLSDVGLPKFDVGNDIEILSWLVENSKGKVFFSAILNRDVINGNQRNECDAVMRFSNPRDEALARLVFDCKDWETEIQNRR